MSETDGIGAAEHGRHVKNIIRALLAVFILGLLTLAGLMAVTPTVASAPDLARRAVQSHGHDDPGAMPPPRFIKALVATEDQRFFQPLNRGLDPVAVLRVGYERLAGRQGDLGGSTISQQLAKMLYGSPHRGLFEKLKEIALALKLSFAFGKPRILAMYAQVAYYGDGYYGLANASCGYFGKPPAGLSWRQAALLAGVVNAPSVDDPRRHPDHADRRTRHVFDRLVDVGVLSRAKANAEEAAPLGLVPRGTGCAP